MSDFSRCPTCHKYGWMASHTCAPVWEVLFEGFGEGWREVHARDAEDAATEAADQFDPDFEYSILRSGAAVARVRSLGSKDEQTFDIEAESVPQYRAQSRP